MRSVDLDAAATIAIVACTVRRARRRRGRPARRRQATSRTATGRRPPPRTTARSARRPVRSPPRRTASAPRSSSSSRTTRAASTSSRRRRRSYPNAPEILEQEALILWETEQQGRRDRGRREGRRRASPQTFTNQKLIGEYYARARSGEDRRRVRGATSRTGPASSRAATCCRASGSASRTSRPRASAIGDGDEPRAQQLYGKAVEQFEIVQRKHGKKPNAHGQRRQRPVRRVHRPRPLRPGDHACASA